MFSKKATKIDKIFTIDLTLCSKCQIDGEDFVNFCGLLRKHELYLKMNAIKVSLIQKLVFIIVEIRQEVAPIFIFIFLL